jgi:hypothetical protein
MDNWKLIVLVVIVLPLLVFVALAVTEKAVN